MKQDKVNLSKCKKEDEQDFLFQNISERLEIFYSEYYGNAELHCFYNILKKGREAGIDVNSLKVLYDQGVSISSIEEFVNKYNDNL